MKALVKTLVFAGALSLLAATDVAAIEDLPCDETKCVFHVLLKEMGTEENRGFCPEVTMTGYNSEMICHPVKGMTCTDAAFVGGKHPYWSCTCTNWNTLKKQTATIDVMCPAPSETRK